MTCYVLHSSCLWQLYKKLPPPPIFTSCLFWVKLSLSLWCFVDLPSWVEQYMRFGKICSHTQAWLCSESVEKILMFILSTVWDSLKYFTLVHLKNERYLQSCYISCIYLKISLYYIFKRCDHTAFEKQFMWMLTYRQALELTDSEDKFPH